MAEEIPLGRQDTGPRAVVAEHELLRRIGAGAYGEVWLARSVTGELRAVKVVWRSRFEHERIYEREFMGLKRFEPISRLHPGLIDVLQVGRDDRAGYFYYVMELADPADAVADAVVGYQVPGTLGEMLRRRGRLPVGECARIGAAVAEALEFLHRQGLVHRDVKPSNILFVGGQAKLADIGLVAGLGDARSFVGTDGYIPPEGPGAAPADLYSLGKVLYEMATGKSRLDFPDLPGGLADAADAAEFGELNEIILRACSPEVGGRHGTAAELRGELLVVDAGRSVRRIRRSERLLSRWRRFGVVTLGLGLLGLVGVILERRQTGLANERARVEVGQRRITEQRELLARQNLYAADMNLVQQAIESGNYGRAEQLLDGYRVGGGNDDLRGFEWHHFAHRVRGDSIGVMTGHEQVVSSLAMGPGEGRLLSAGFDGTVREWSLEGLREVRRWNLPGSAIMSMSLDPAGKRLAVEGGNRPVSGVLDLESGKWVTRVTSASPSVQFAPGGGRLVRGADMYLFDTNGVVEVVDLAMQVERRLEGAGGRAWFSPDGQLLVTGSWGEAVRFWSWPGLESRGELGGVGTVLALAFSPDGKRMATGTRAGRLTLWDVAGRSRLKEQTAHEGTLIWSLAFSPDGTRLASGGNDQTVRAWDGSTLEPQRVYRGHGSEVWSVVWTPDGKRLISAGKDTDLRVWDAVPKPDPLELSGVGQVPVFSRDSRYLAARRRKSGIGVWELGTGRLLFERDGVELGGFGPDGGSLSLLRDDRTSERWRLSDGKLVERRTVLAPSTPFTRRRLSEDGRWLVTGGEDGGILLQDLSGANPARHLNGHRQMIVALEFSPDGRRLMSGSIDRTALLWELETGQRLECFEGHRMAVGSVAFGVGGDWMATGSWDDTVRVWRSGEAGKVRTFGGHATGVHGVAFSPDHRTLAVLSGAGVLKFWSLAAGREAGVLEMGRGTGLGQLRFSPDGQWLAVVNPGDDLILLRAPREKGEVVR